MPEQNKPTKAKLNRAARARTQALLNTAHRSAVYGLEGIEPLILDCLPPSANSQYMAHGGRRFLSPEVRAFRQLVTLQARQQRWAIPKGDAFVLVGVLCSDKWITADGRLARRDIDNRIKQTLDAVQGATGINDSQIVRVDFVKANGQDKTLVYVIPIQLPMI